MKEGGTYIHGSVYSINTPLSAATLDAGSNFIYRGNNTMTPAHSFSGKTYENLSFESTSGAYTLSASGSNPFIVNGNFTIGQGVTFTSYMTGTMIFGGNFTNNGILKNDLNTQVYTFSGIGKTISGTGAVGFETWNVSSGASILLGKDVSVASGFTAIISGTLDCSTYKVTGEGTFSLPSGGTLKIGSADGIASSGATGSIQTVARNFDAGANYVYNGTSAQLTGSGLPASVNSLTIDNPMGVTLSGDLSVTNALTITNGNLNLNGKTLTYGSVTGNNLYGLSESASLKAPNGVNLGNLGAVISSSANLGFTTVTRGFNPLSGNGNSGIKRWYKISPTANTGLNASLVFSYNDGDELNGIPEANLRLFKSTNDGLTWTLEGGTIDAGANTVTLSGIDGFSLWTLGNIDFPMPVTLSSFNSVVTNRSIKLNWVTETELNNSGFEIQRAVISNQLSDYSKIGYVEGNGTKNTPTTYTFEDKNLNTGKYKYRLKQVDVNGNFEYFELNGEVEIGVPKKYDVSQNYPNPFNPVTKINFDLPENGLVNIRLYDMLGREVAVIVNEVRNAGYHTVQFDASKLSSGIYFYKMNAGKFSGVKKMAVLK